MTFDDIGLGDMCVLRYISSRAKNDVYKVGECVSLGASYRDIEVNYPSDGPTIVKVTHDGYVYGENTTDRIGRYAEIAKADFTELVTA